MAELKHFIYGIHPIQMALTVNPWRIQVLYLAREKAKTSNYQKMIELAKTQRIAYQLVDINFFKKHYQSYLHQGIVAEVSPLQLKNKNDLFDLVEKNNRLLLVLIAKMQDGHNLGAIIRSAQGLGVDGIIFNQNRTPPLNHTVSKVSSGAIETANLFMINNLGQLIDQLKQLDIWFYGLDMKGKKMHNYLKNNALAKKKVLVIGEEEKGISDLIEKKCDEILSIEMTNKVESLNASASFAIALYQFIHYNNQK